MMNLVFEHTVASKPFKEKSVYYNFMHAFLRRIDANTNIKLKFVTKQIAFEKYANSFKIFFSKNLIKKF